MADAGATPPRYYEYIVIGCGGVGSGTLYWLSKRAQSSEYTLRVHYIQNFTNISHNDVSVMY